MFNYDELIWTISFPLFCTLVMWFSIALALLVRSEGGRCRREAIRDSIMRMEQRGEHVSPSLRRNGKAILRCAVVVVGGEFAKSPRMQYHAASLMNCGLFDGVILVGFDMGNSLIDSLQSRNDDNLRDDVACTVDTKYLISPVNPPSWFSFVFWHPRLYWICATLYRICVYTVVFTWALICASLMVVNGRGQLWLVDLILVQSPPALPFVPLLKYLVRPCVLLVNGILYYCFIVPVSWMMRDALREIREELKLQQKHNLQPSTEKDKLDPPSRFVFCPSLIVDWHNFGYTILQSDGRPSLAVWLYKMLECHVCFGDRNMTVSKAMQRALRKLQRKKMGKDIKSCSSMKTMTDGDVVVLYDTAPSFFGSLPRVEFVQKVLRSALPSTSENAKEIFGLSPPPAWVMRTEEENNDEKNNNGGIQNINPNGLFMVGSTSWTLDDDYSMVVEALARIDKRLQDEAKKGNETQVGGVRPIWLLVTGQGVTRERFERAVVEAHLSPLVTVSTTYFQSYVDYAMALGASDVGLCIHHSSSGLDLPMKAVDMLGSGLPVVALRYEALIELLDEKHGWMFSNADELEQILWDISRNNSNENNSSSITLSLEQKRLHIRRERRKTWDENWNSVVLPLLKELLRCE